MKNDDGQELSRASSAFAIASGITVLFSTALAIAKDSYSPLAILMARPTGHNWTTQGIVDVVLFFCLGLVFFKTGVGASVNPQRLAWFVSASVVAAGIGLVVWFALF